MEIYIYQLTFLFIRIMYFSYRMTELIILHFINASNSCWVEKYENQMSRQRCIYI